MAGLFVMLRFIKKRVAPAQFESRLYSTLTTLSANLGSNAGVSAKCFYNSFICEVRIEGKTTTTFPNWGGYRLGILPEKARPKQNIVEYLYESFYLEIGTDEIGRASCRERV